MPKGKGPGAPFGNKNAAGPHKGKSKRMKDPHAPRGHFPTPADVKLTAGAYLRKLGEFAGSKVGTLYSGPYKPGYYKSKKKR